MVSRLVKGGNLREVEHISVRAPPLCMHPCLLLGSKCLRLFCAPMYPLCSFCQSFDGWGSGRREDSFCSQLVATSMQSLTFFMSRLSQPNQCARQSTSSLSLLQSTGNSRQPCNS